MNEYIFAQFLMPINGKVMQPYKKNIVHVKIAFVKTFYWVECFLDCCEVFQNGKTSFMQGYIIYSNS